MDIAIDNTKKRRRQKYIAIAAGLVLLALLYMSFRHSGERRFTSSIDKFTIATVTRANFGEYIAIEGKAMPMKSIFLDAIEGGVIEKILVEDGALVEKDQPLIELSNTNIQLDIMGRQTNLYELKKYTVDSFDTIPILQIRQVSATTLNF
jgi:HlyD family secretion protein